MARQLSHTLAAEYPEYVSFSKLLDLSEITFNRYGIDAEKLSEMDDWQMEMLLVKLGL